MKIKFSTTTPDPNQDHETVQIGTVTLKRIGEKPLLFNPYNHQFYRQTETKLVELDQFTAYAAAIRALCWISGTNAEFSRQTGFSLDTVKSWRSGRRQPHAGTIKLLLYAYGIIPRIRWRLT